MATPWVDSIAEVFAGHGLRCTRQRRALYEALSSTKAHPTADQLYRDVAPKVRGMSLATVYNTLEAFCNAGLAQKLHGSNGSARYDAMVDNHIHARDERTGEVFDVPDEISHRLLDRIPQDILDQIEKDLGFRIRQIQVELLGERKRDDLRRGLPSRS